MQSDDQDKKAPAKDLLYVVEKEPFLLSSREKPAICKPERASALDRVRGFLPKLQQSNEVLAEKVKEAPQSVDIEHIENDEKGHIELCLALGVNDEEEEENDVVTQQIDLPENSTETEDPTDPKLIQDISDC
mmetsp:Transcript_123263/g.184350  ORF Transcript_123263/g.184350 Transcript_123263/m.184350 type:complete len:132 (+) Transcript_123263:356-751(+)|eukprot:CAMPEP_0117045454 /NCGR_PEP_ID=MMETSP0472-20121206/31446_1 /TAXON_ID=693140 ORGANISM="Tiarina fusus, Strain LIS" /NCGR_SAMPLE_ID=MMETSP0472 /ASSEMBLY_ACC=CAM_ASM_000603 /LENGTH=131 /DNA_ID=CAMNT_0004757463 /DNA_START=979 /DNA_END=1377 /DNA_ORIENTATION=+